MKAEKHWAKFVELKLGELLSENDFEFVGAGKRAEGEYVEFEKGDGSMLFVVNEDGVLIADLLVVDGGRWTRISLNQACWFLGSRRKIGSSVNDQMDWLVGTLNQIGNSLFAGLDSSSDTRFCFDISNRALAQYLENQRN